MISISVATTVADVKRQLAAVHQRHIPYAASVALNAVGQLVLEAEQHEMRDVFDRPTPGTLNSVYLIRSTKASLTATVKLKDETAKGTPAAKYLLSEVTGGVRRLKRFEKALAAVGALPPGYYAVPGAGARMDNYGNMSAGQIVQILSYFKAFPEAGYKANITDARKAKLARGTKRTVGYDYFVGRPGDGRLPLGIYQRFKFASGTAIKPIIIFVPGVLYQATYDFGYVARKVVEREFNNQFAIALNSALATVN